MYGVSSFDQFFPVTDILTMAPDIIQNGLFVLTAAELIQGLWGYWTHYVNADANKLSLVRATGLKSQISNINHTDGKQIASLAWQ